MKCPVCSGAIKKGIIREEMFGVDLGTFPGLICSKCNETFMDQKTTKLITEAAKKKGLWGLGASTRITKAGNSLSVRIPKKMADYLKIEDGSEAYMHPDGRKIVIELPE
jgi:transposase-like protein